ncbi:MAG: outer membrane protein assembly factor [Bacteroidales bacterium]|jgi:outer membrane protein assembly factor BamA|nr:outer membrane protein assembly factor [Bacteroidales bacterium]
MAKRIWYSIFFVSAFFLFFSCSPYKHITQNGYLLKENKIIIHHSDDNIEKSEFKNLLKQEPNTKFLGFKMRMYIYSLSKRGEDSTMNFFSKNLFRRLGEKPVEYNDDLAYRSLEDIRGYLKTKGCFNATATDSIKIKKRKASVYYYIDIKERYKIDSLIISSKDSSILSEVLDIMSLSPIKKGIYYDEQVFSSERDRLTLEMKKRGYYDFTKEYVVFNVDTSNNNNRVRINLDILPRTIIRTDSSKNGIQSIVTSFKKFKIKNIYIYTNHLMQTSLNNEIEFDTTILFHRQKDKYALNRYVIISTLPKTMKIKPILRSVTFQRDSLFSPSFAEQTYNALNQLRNFKFIDISYIPTIVDKNKNLLDTAYLDCVVKLSPSKPIMLSTSLEANFSKVTNSLLASNSSNLGMEWNMSFQHRNIFKGAEIFSFSPKVALEMKSDIFNTKDTINKWSLVNAFEAGFDFSLELPRFLIPFGTRLYSMQFMPHTTIKTGYNYQKRTYFERSIFNLNFGYSWNKTTKFSHAIIPMEINLVKIDITSPSYADYIAVLDKRTQYQYSDHLVTNTRYSFQYNGQDLLKKEDFTYIRLNVESSGNILHLLSDASKIKKNNENSQYTIFDIPYSQYVRTDIDFKQYYYITKRQVLVLRTYAGIGIPYGNSTALPYEKSFFAGGNNNLRAWELRELGPGSSKTDDSELKYDRSGDMTWGANIEYRFPIIGIFEGGAFIDVGNIWTIHSQENFKGGQFKFNSFYKELATGVGLGLRINLQFLILRLDFAVKAYDPSKDMKDRFVLPKTTFNQLKINFGIGYPF